MKWEKMSQDTAKRLEALVQPLACQKKPMFGHDIYWVNGNMFTGVFQSVIFFRLSPKDQNEFLGKYKDAVFEWIKRSFEYTKSLPEKKAKSKKVQKQ